MQPIFLKHRNTAYCNTIMLDTYEALDYWARTALVGSDFIPLNQVYYVDSEGVLTVHTLPQEQNDESE